MRKQNEINLYIFNINHVFTASLHGEERLDAFDIAQVWVPAGTFMMGTEDPDAYDPPIWGTRKDGASINA